MAGRIVTSAAGPSEAIFGELKENWGWLFGMGVLFIILGVVGLGRLFALSLAGALFFGVLIVIGGVAQLIEALKCRRWKGVAYHVSDGDTLYLRRRFCDSGPLGGQDGSDVDSGGSAYMRGRCPRRHGPADESYGRLVCALAWRRHLDHFGRNYSGPLANVRSLCHRPVYRSRTYHKRLLLHLHCACGQESKQDGCGIETF